MDGGQLFCTYPGSLPPHSISRQSIKSSRKKERKEPATETLRVLCCFSAAAYLNPDGHRLDAGLRKSTAI